METILFFLPGVLLSIICILSAKIWFLRQSIREISRSFRQHLEMESNTLIDLSSRDRDMRILAEEINRQLRVLRRLRHRYQSGDREWKEAVANVSHDLRTPLTAIRGYAELLAREPLSKTAATYLAVIRERCETMLQLTEELFRYSLAMSAGTMEWERVCLNSVLEESIAGAYEILRQRGIVPQVWICQSRIERTLNRSALNRVFQNLLHNAAQYSEGNLEIVLLESGEIHFVNDAGSLTPVQMGKLFDRYFTVKEARPSTGLGLAISRSLVEQMGGSIQANLTEGRLRVILQFPM